MANRDPLRDEAFNLFRDSRGKLTSKQIAEKLNKSINTINSWRNKDEWTKRLKGGAPRGNINAKGHGAPRGNLNNLKHGNYCDPTKFTDKGFLAKYIPKATQQIIKSVVEEGVSTLDMLYDSIVLLYTSLIRSQKIMNVTSRNDDTKLLKREKVTPTNNGEGIEQEYEIQFAGDRQEKFVNTQSKAMKTLNKLINDYEELLRKNWDLASEEQKVRIEVLKSKINSNNDAEQNVQIVDDIDD